MSAKPAVVIAPIDFDQASRAVEQFSAERKIPSMVFPVPEAVGQARGSDLLPNAEVPISPHRIHRLPVELPDYVVADIKRRAIDGRCSARHVIMNALRGAGIHIADEDMPKDARRARH